MLGKALVHETIDRSLCVNWPAQYVTQLSIIAGRSMSRRTPYGLASPGHWRVWLSKLARQLIIRVGKK